MSSPLFDTLFRPTAVSDVDASAAPVRAKGSHTRAGNAMSRTRAALLAGAALAVETTGTKITMAQVAAASRVAKATLYNHFRTRDAVLAALVLDQVEQLVAAHASKPLEEALTDAALAISTHPLRRGLARVEPATLAAIAAIDTSTAGWDRALKAVEMVLGDSGRAGSGTVVRWLASFLLTPADARAIAADVAVLVPGLPHVAAQQARPA